MEYPVRRIVALLLTGTAERVFASESLLRCVACFACSAKCPRGIDLTGLVLALVKEQVLTQLPALPAELQKALENTFRYGNPMGESPRKRAAWTRTASVPVTILSEGSGRAEVLWWVECYNAYHPRGQECARATARLLHALALDFAILGNEERCAGECGRLSWERGLFDSLMESNLAVLGKYQIGCVVTSCPHAYDAFRHRYVPAGFQYPLFSMPEFLVRHLDRLRSKLTRKLGYTVTFHDGCCLGRHNQLYEESRQLLRAIPGIRLIEMTHNRINSLCCGGGGGGMWLDSYYKAQGMQRLSERRVKEAAETDADVLAVACPYEISRFEDAVKVLGYDKKMVVRDVSELLAESMEG